VYLFGLPYEFNEETKLRNTIKLILENVTGVDSIKDMKMYEYKNFLDIEHYKEEVDVPDDYEKFFDPAKMKKIRYLQKNGSLDLEDKLSTI